MTKSLDAKLAEDGLEMRLDRVHRDEQVIRDLRVREVVFQTGDDRSFAFGQRLNEDGRVRGLVGGRFGGADVSGQVRAGQVLHGCQGSLLAHASGSCGCYLRRD